MSRLVRINARSSHEGFRYAHNTTHATKLIHQPASASAAVSARAIVSSPAMSGRTIKAEWHSNTELSQQSMDSTSCTEQRHNHCEECLDRVSSGIVPQILNHPLQLMHQILDIPISRPSLIVRRPSTTPKDPSTSTAQPAPTTIAVILRTSTAEEAPAGAASVTRSRVGVRVRGGFHEVAL